jgi:hypothetical protein
MNSPFWLSNKSKPDLLAARLDELRDGLLSRNPQQLARNTGAVLLKDEQDHSEFHFKFWDQEIILPFPELIAYEQASGEALPQVSQALLLYYFSNCDGTKPSGEWISFSALPDGLFYNQAYQGYTGGKLSQAFQNKFEDFCQVAENLGGKRVYLLGDAAYEYQLLPLVNLLVLTWQGDEDFNAAYQVLFDAAVSHHMPTDACAITGSSLTQRLIKELEKRDENRS